MKAKQVGWGLLLTFCGGWVGYNVHRTVHPNLLLGAETTPQLEYFTRPESFSKVENTKALLEALCQRMLVESENRFWSAQKLHSDSTQEQREMEVMIGDLERGMHEFAGTDQELDFVRDLLMVLKHSQNFGRWTDVYLKVVYEHPMHPVTTKLADEALVISRAVGRENEVLAGLEHLHTIPLDFDGKDRLTAILATAETHRVLTRFDAARNSSQPGS